MTELMKYQLEQALDNIQTVKKEIDSRRENDDNDYLDSYHYELLDLELRLKDMINHIHKI